MIVTQAAVRGTIDRVLRPRSIAVLGASSRKQALSARFIGGLQRHGYTGRIVPVNPRYEEVLGLRCYPTIADASEEGPVDLVMVSIARDRVLDALEECHAAGAVGAVIFTSGFAETGDEGLAAQAKLTELADRTGLRLLGPNSPGFINAFDSICLIASSVSFRDRFVPGGVGIISQSGGVTGVMVERAQDRGVGISIAACTGNEADLAVADLLPWYAAHEPTKVVAIFLEGIRKPEALVAGFELLRDAGKHVVVLKAGATEAAARATSAHTGALASDDDVVSAVFVRFGIVRVDSYDDFIDTALALERLGTSSGRRVGIITTSGGAGVLATEAAERAGLELPPLSPETQEKLAAVVPHYGSTLNPADMSGMFSEDPGIFAKSVAVFGDADEFDASIPVLTAQPPEFSVTLADLVIENAKAASRLPVVLWTAGALSDPGRARLRNAGLVVFEDPDRCMRALAARTIRPLDGDPLPAITAPPLPAKSRLLEAEALELVAAAGVPVARTTVCPTPEEAAAAGAALEGRVVVKAAARDLLHKTDAGAVVVGVEGAEAIEAAHRTVVEAARAAGSTPEGAIVQQLAPDGLELIVGVRRDPDFGAILVVGPGGLTAELDGDVARRLLPLRIGEADAMLRELRMFPLLEGHRGAPPADLAAAARTIEALARLALALGRRLEAIEINPLIVHRAGLGATAVDALVLLAEATEA